MIPSKTDFGKRLIKELGPVKARDYAEDLPDLVYRLIQKELARIDRQPISKAQILARMKAKRLNRDAAEEDIFEERRSYYARAVE